MLKYPIHFFENKIKKFVPRLGEGGIEMSMAKRIMGPWILTFILLGLWEIAILLELINKSLMPPPSDIFPAWWDMLLSGTLLKDMSASIKRILIGFSIAAVLGIPLGIVLNTSSKVITDSVLRLVNFFRTIAPIAWITIAIYLFGIGDKPAVFIVVIGAVFPIILNTYEGVSQVPISYVNAARSLGARRSLIIVDVLLPAALPQIMTGLRIGLGLAWTSIIAAELVGAQSGLGYMIPHNGLFLRYDNVLAGMMTIGLIGLTMNTLSYWLEKKITPWSDKR